MGQRNTGTEIYATGQKRGDTEIKVENVDSLYNSSNPLRDEVKKQLYGSDVAILRSSPFIQKKVTKRRFDDQALR